jgi:ribonuclease BN (tRNA processing enzyme)
MIITVLGSCANHTALREGVAFIVEDRDQQTRILVDAGPGVVGALGRCSRSAAEIDNVVLTHTHGDHISGFAYFVWQRHYERLGSEQPAANLDVYGLENATELASRMLYGCYSEVRFPFEVRFHQILKNSEFKIDELRVATCGTQHTTPSIGCSFTDGKNKVAISSDTLRVDDFVTLAKNSDLLFHEGMWTEAHRPLADKSMHATAKDAGLVATAARARQLALMHVFPLFIGKEGALLREARTHFDGPISVPHDGSVYIV